MAAPLSVVKRATHTCSRCDYRFDASRSQCPSCKQWNVPEGATAAAQGDQTVLLSEVTGDDVARYETGPWDICFGGGIVTTSTTLIGGTPGAGKSTLSLQLADAIARTTKREILYVGTEESAKEIKARADRLRLKNQPLIRVFPMGSNADMGAVFLARKPSAIILDSLPGLTPDQDMAVELCKRLKDYAVTLTAPVLIIDHVTKQDDFAGLMSLQHAVDTLLTLYPTHQGEKRELTTLKNRHGPANISTNLEMTPGGLISLGDEDEDEDGSGAGNERRNHARDQGY